MKISIITPVFNSAKTIERCIQSVLSQTLEGVEHILVDGKSSDESLSIIQNFSDSRIRFISEKDEGVYDAMNKGLQIASGEWVFFLGSDDFLSEPDILKKIFDAVSPPEPDIILLSIKYIDGPVMRSKFNWSLILRNYVHHQGCLYRRNLFNERRFDKNLKIYGDYDFNLYLKKRKVRSISLPYILSHCSLRGLSDRPKLKHCLEQIRVRRKYFSVPASIMFDGINLLKFSLKKLKEISRN